MIKIALIIKALGICRIIACLLTLGYEVGVVWAMLGGVFFYLLNVLEHTNAV